MEKIVYYIELLLINTVIDGKHSRPPTTHPHHPTHPTPNPNPHPPPTPTPTHPHPMRKNLAQYL